MSHSDLQMLRNWSYNGQGYETYLDDSQENDSQLVYEYGTHFNDQEYYQYLEGWDDNYPDVRVNVLNDLRDTAKEVFKRFPGILEAFDVEFPDDLDAEEQFYVSYTVDLPSDSDTSSDSTDSCLNGLLKFKF